MNLRAPTSPGISSRAHMQLRQSSSRRDDENRLIPLINVVFLMLIFFLLVGTIRSPAPLVISPPVSLADHPPASQAITVTVDAQTQVFVNDKKIAPEEVGAMSSAVRALWTDVDGKDEQLRRLEIRADKSLVMQDLGPIISALTKAGADEISLITQR